MVQDSATPANSPLAPLATRYQRLLAHADAAERELARRQLAALDRLAQHPRAPTTRASGSTSGRFAHVPIADLFERAGNLLQVRGHTARCGHEPVHSSKSGNCLIVWLATQRWWCSSCRAGGDAVAALASLDGVDRRTAATRLTNLYGPLRRLYDLPAVQRPAGQILANTESGQCPPAQPPTTPVPAVIGQIGQILPTVESAP